MGTFSKVFEELTGNKTVVRGTQGAVGVFTVDSAAEGNVTIDDPDAVITDVADTAQVTVVGKGKTVQEYFNEAMKKGGKDAASYINEKTNAIVAGMAQSNAVQVASLVAYKGLERDGIDQINPTVNPVLLRTLLGRFVLPSMITVNPISVSFNAGGACYVGGTQIKPDVYDPTVLSKSFILGGPKMGGKHWPIFGYDIAVRSFSTEVGDAKVDVTCYDTTTVASESGLDENAKQMYSHSYHLIDKDAQGKLVCSLATGNSVLTCGGLVTALETNHYLYFNQTSQAVRDRDCAATISVDTETDEFVNSILKISGINVILTITPLLVCKESVARVINNLDKDVAGYIGALANLRNSDQDKFSY